MKFTRRLSVLLLSLSSGVGSAQRGLWVHFDTSITDVQPRQIAELGTARQQALQQFALHTPDDPDCDSEPQGWEKTLLFNDVRVGGPRVTFVYGSCNQAVTLNWLVAWNGNQPRSLAAKWAIGCSFHRAQPHISHGLHDFTMSCHQSADATDYAWYRFDGRMYRRISVACAYDPWMWNSASLRAVRRSGWDASMRCYALFKR